MVPFDNTRCADGDPARSAPPPIPYPESDARGTVHDEHEHDDEHDRGHDSALQTLRLRQLDGELVRRCAARIERSALLRFER